MMTPRSFMYSRQRASPPPTPPSSSPLVPSKLAFQKRKDGRTTKITSTPRTIFTTTIPNDIMAKRKTSDRLSPPSSSPPRETTATAVAERPTTSSSAVQIPVKPKQETAHPQRTRHHHHHTKREHTGKHRSRNASHDPDSIPPSVAALLAITNIPPPPRRGSLKQRQAKEARMTVDSIVPRSQVSEKQLSHELSLNSSLGRSPLELLLSPPEDLEEEDCSVLSDSALNSAVSTRAGSFDSLASLGDSFVTGTISSIETPYTPRGRRSQSVRRSLSPITFPVDKDDHPLSIQNDMDIEKLDFRVFEDPSPVADKRRPSALKPFKSAFKSNLTASLKALRSAARSISALTASSIPPDDFLTRSILTIDPSVPFTDERRPPVLEEEPTAAMRRYLNPTSAPRLERPATPVRSFTASIQMQTYKVQRSRSAPPTTDRQSSIASSPNSKQSPLLFPVGPRQREVRENSDFIRIAVLEHLMRKRGKLDDQREGHARWLLPPRKLNTKAYDIGPDGVPARWVAIVHDVA